MRRRVVLLGMALLLLLLPVSEADADEHLDQFGPVDLVEMVFFPFLPHGGTIDTTGPWQGSITVQNLESEDVRIWAATDAGFDPQTALGTWVLPPRGAITLSGAALGLEEPGSPIVIAGVFRSLWEADAEEIQIAIDAACDGGPERIPDNDGWHYSCKPSISGVAKLTSPEALDGATGARTNAAHLMTDGYNGIPAQDVAWGSQSVFCKATVAKWSDDCSGVGTYEPRGYGLGFDFDGHSYLPIVQNNSGWNTEIRISNVDPSVWAGQVTVTLLASNQQGHAAGESHRITFERVLRPGQSWRLNLRDSGVPENWVGSAHITSNVGVVAQALRINTEQKMLRTNVAAPSTWAATSPAAQNRSSSAPTEVQSEGDGSYKMYGPLVFQSYSGWNTGISIANIDEAATRVTVRFHDITGRMRSVDTRRIPAQGQEYIYIPAGPESDAAVLDGWVGAVTLSADAPFHATVDQVKYSTGEAMSYMATSAGARRLASPDALESASWTLSLPLMQKGKLDGFGDTSGIQLFNPSAAGSVEAEIWFHSQIGERLPPTNYGPLMATIPARAGYNLYVMNLSGMVPSTIGTATVEVRGGAGQLTGVSNNVNDAVSRDGATVFNLVNSRGQYRVPVSQTE